MMKSAEEEMVPLRDGVRPVSISEMREAFALFDKDGDGCITASELVTVMCSLGQRATEQEAKDMIRQVDTDGNGLIDFNEFYEMMESRLPSRQRSQDAEMRALFLAFDKDNNGYIDGIELKATMHDVGLDLTDRDIEMMMKAAGVAIKDRIFYEDFVRMMTGNIGLAQMQRGPDTVGVSNPPDLLGYSVDDPDTQELRVAFSMFDKDGDGQISVNEVHDTMQSLGIHIDMSQVKAMVKHVDTNGDGSISFSEFREVLDKYKSSRRTSRLGSPTDSCASSELDLRDTFQIFDKDEDGYLNAVDLRCTMKQLGMSLTEEDVHAMMRSVGVGPHGKISYPDFCKMFHFNGRHALGKEVKVRPRKRISENFSADQQQELQAVFSVFDKDGDGFISVDEVGKVLASMGIHPSEDYICEIFRQVDLDGNSKIDFREFLLLVQNYERPLSEEQEIREMFNAIDTDRSGFIDVDELRSTFAKLGVPLSNTDVKDMLREANIQGNRIFFEDFVQIMMGKIGQAQKEHLATFPSVAAAAPTNGVKEKGSVDSTRSSLTEEQLKELRIQFAQFDKDCDGVISPKELCQVMNSLGLSVTLEVVQKVLHRADLDNNGRIDFADFCKLMVHQRSLNAGEQSQLEEHDTRQVFKVFDKNRDGYIDEQELRQTMQELGMMLSADDIKAMMTKAGCRITGRIYYEEFVKIMFGEMLKPGSKARSSPVSDEILQELRVAFAMFDKDADGRITPRELMSVMSGLGFKSDDVLIKQMIGRFDADGNGTLEFNEFRDMMKASMDGTTRWEKLKKAHTPPDTWKAFKVFDRNADGYISKTELYQTMKELGVKLSMDDLNEMMKAADINQDGRIDYAEFSKLMNGAFKSFAKQAAQLDEQKSLYEAVFQQNLNPSDLQQAFDGVDRDHDGVINTDELEQVARSLGLNVSRSKAETIINRFGNKGAGTMDLNQFMTALSRADESSAVGRQRRSGGADRQDMHTAFRVFDANSDGYIDAAELRATMRDLTGDALTDADVDAMIRSADCDGDGRINYEEFVKMMRSK